LNKSRKMSLDLADKLKKPLFNEYLFIKGGLITRPDFKEEVINMNTIKTAGLMVALTFILVLIGRVVGGEAGMVIALLFSLGTNFVSYFFSDKIVLTMYGAREVNEDSAPELYDIVMELSTRAGLPMPRVYIMDAPYANAFATGRNPKHSAVAVTSGILRILNRDELSGVIAHELGHIKNRDILISTIAASIAGAIGTIAYMAKWAAIFGGGRDDEDGGSPVAMIAMAIIAPIAAMIIQMAISRAREYKADAAGAEISGNPEYLANALLKLQAGADRIHADVNPSAAHMFIVNPLSGDFLKTLFSTHPSTESRVQKLREMLYRGR